MLFVIDVGNTNIVAGVYDGHLLLHHWRMETNRNKTDDELGMIIRDFLHHEGLDFSQIEAIMVSSVVPPIMYALENMCLKYFGKKPLVVGPGVKTGLNIHTENPRELGADRIVNAVAGIHEYGTPLIIIDFGTATTYCFIDEHGTYQGGAIAPGIGISTEALYTRAAKLPRIELVIPDSVLGKNTVTSMQSGILFGYVGQVEGIVERLKKLSKKPPTVIATGGLAPIIASETTVIDKVDLLLTLKGLQLIYQKNK